MASTTETGHQKNVENFSDLIDAYVGFGSPYNPTNALITIAAMQQLLTDSDTALQDVTDATTPFIDATNDRQEIFADMQKLATRTINAFDSTQGITKKQVDDARTFIHKIRGERVAEVDPNIQRTISVSQQSYDNLYKHFREMVTYITDHATYVPNEVDLTAAALTQFVTDLKNINRAVSQAEKPLKNARIARNRLIYTEETGLIDVALESKKYIKSAFGATSAEYNQIKGIEFKRLSDPEE